MKSQGHVSGHQGSHNHNTRDEVQFRVFSSFIVTEIPEHILRCLPSAGHWFFSFNNMQRKLVGCRLSGENSELVDHVATL